MCNLCIMKKAKEGLRLFIMVLLFVLAIFGIGLTGNFLNNNRERYMDNEIKNEAADKKEDEEDVDDLKNQM